MLKQGSIVLAKVLDPQGHNPKIRPVAIVSPAEAIAADEPLVGVAITGVYSDPLAMDEVPLPYHPVGKAHSGLRKPCVAKCQWLVTLSAADIVEMKGFLPQERVDAILNVLAKLPTDTGQP